MSTIAVVTLFIVRLILPVSLLLALGEWLHRREANYWLHNK